MKFLFGSTPSPFEIFQATLVVAAVLLAFLWPSLGSRLFIQIEGSLRRLSSRPALSCVLAGLVPLLLRALLLPVYGVPQPGIHDEFAYLLQSDTFSSGRWTNPTPPLPANFESIYIVVRPTYAAQYQLAPALAMAAAQVLTGIPWLGIFFSMGIACGLLVWMLRAWVSPPWALTGALIAAFQFGVLSYWMNGYFGSVTALIGGALALGALPRIRQSRPWLYSSLLAIGLAILMHSRPLEAFLLFLISAGAIIRWKVTPFSAVAIPMGAILLASTALMAYYDFKVTGNPLQPPYLLNQKLYGTPQGFYWQPPVRIGHFPNAQLRDEYLAQLRLHERRNSLKALITGTLGRIRVFWGFFLTPVFTIPLLWLPNALRKAPGLALAILVIFGFEYLTFFAFLPQYAAPICGLVLVVILLCLRQMRSSATGLFLCRALPILCALSVFVPMLGRYAQPILPAKLWQFWSSEFGPQLYREKFLKNLLAQGGRHLVVVRYGPNHQVDTEWVYNNADIAHSPVIWARELDAHSAEQLIAAFPGRKVWLGEPDADPPALIPFPSVP